MRVLIEECESGVHCTPAPHFEAFAARDEFAAALESRAVAELELCDGVRVVVRVPLGEQQPIGEPQETSWIRRRNAREFLQLVAVAAQSTHAHSTLVGR